MNILIICDPVVTMAAARDSLARLVQAAAPLGKMTVLITGAVLPDRVEALAALVGVQRVLLVEHAALTDWPVENGAALIAELATQSGFTHIVTTHSSFGIGLLPRVAALLDVAAVTGVTEIIDTNTFIRPVQTGAFLATVQVCGKPVCLTLHTAGLEPAASVAVTTVSVDRYQPTTDIHLGLSRLLERLPLAKTPRPDLAAASVVVAGGGGLEQAGNFNLIETLADLLGAAVGASRAAVDAELAPSAWQIGQTGQIIAPEWYIGIGISGAIQHLAGIKAAKTIVAINHDPAAPLVAVADYSLVADLYQAVPEWIRLLQTQQQ